jgi:GT2 family glycosyltransferase
VAYTDDDVLVGPAWPSAIAGAFSADPCAACVTGPVVARRLDTGAQRYLEARVPWGEDFEPRRYDRYLHRQPSRLYPFTAGMFGTGANFAVRTGAMELVGGFDELLGAGGPGRGGEDLDMFLRLILAGQRICYAPCALVWHEHYAEVGALDAQMYSYGHGLGAYLAKHLSAPGLRSALARHGVRHLGVLARRMRGATAVSGLASGGTRLALSEARGVVVGAWRYWRAAHQAARRS